jgi:hypothetical protein
MSFLGLPAGAAVALLAAAAGAVVLLYLLKPSARRVSVASSQIWQRVLKERKRRPERLRWWLSLLLALAIALSIAGALTRPEIAPLSGTADQVVVVVDNSASLATRTGDGRTRFEHAIERAELIVKASGAGSRFLIADTMRATVAPAFEPAAAALERLRALQVVPGGTPWFPDLGELLAGERRQLWLVTDGVANIAAPRGTRTISVFQVADNAGLTAFEVRALPSDARRHEAHLEVTNASAGNKAVELRLVGVGAAPVARRVLLAGGASATMAMDVSSFAEGPLQASVRTDGDALALDDSAYAYLPGKSRVRVALVTRGNEPLARTLEVLPRVDLKVLPPERQREARGADAIVFDGVAPAQQPSVPALLVGPNPPAWLARRAGSLRDTFVAWWDGTHALLSGLAPRDVLVEHAAVLQARGPDETGAPLLAPVARGPAGEPLILATRAGKRFVVVGFALEQSNFAAQPGFPAFLSNTIDWLTREPFAMTQALGQARVPLPDARVFDLDGKQVPARQAPGTTLFDAREPGLYTAVTREDRVRVAVNVLDPRTTRVNGERLDHPGVTADVPPRARTAIEPWIGLLVAAALLLAIDWLTYHRRVTV